MIDTYYRIIELCEIYSMTPLKGDGAMLEIDYDAEEIYELFKEEGRKEERLNV